MRLHLHLPPHRKLARLTAEQERLTKEIQEHKQAWAERNFLSQKTRVPVSTPEITAFKQHHRDLSCALSDVNLQIGQVNREIREHKAELQGRKANGRTEAQPTAVITARKKEHPVKQRPDFCVYFRLAAENELEPRLFSHIERVAKSLIHAAVQNGVEQGDR